MCSSMLSLKFFVYSNERTENSENRDQRMHQVVAYKGLKEWKISDRQAQKVVVVAYRVVDY